MVDADSNDTADTSRYHISGVQLAGLVLEDLSFVLLLTRLVVIHTVSGMANCLAYIILFSHISAKCICVTGSLQECLRGCGA
jgi:arginine repressor